MLKLFGKGKASSKPNTDALPASLSVIEQVEGSAFSKRYVFDEPLPAEASGKNIVLRLQCAACYLPHPEKLHYGGEDAYFISDVCGGAMGVADGVGGWQETGVNPADYSRMFMKMACEYLEGSGKFSSEGGTAGAVVDPRGALSAGHQQTKVPGSATACVMQLDPEHKSLEAANLGDSGFMVIRNKRSIAKSRPLQHYFDCPLQFGAFPEYVEATDTAEMADTYSIPLAPGDVIVAGSDGLWDNVFESEIIELAPRSAGDVQRAATTLANLAQQHAGDSEFQSPYVKEALSQGLDIPWWEKLLGTSFKGGRCQLKQLSGGKMDDITVLIAFVAESDVPPAQRQQEQQ
ncbi:serine/threonine protein phosphatase [Dunaliella salina]|uniref:Protein phosphatase n=1 Tax=Dunaliella salina TaxID=3046 RepID=A0ABQ7GUT6_DUNSA|nr:serine/threonine protein phosphatase [Dunaliella salina]|eukprot:KAF5838380.1 serine/threonine protein phosphatase [Dunaliella salina]